MASGFGDHGPSVEEATFWQRLADGQTVPFRAGGDSMRPLYPSRSLFLIQPVTAAALRRGDLVLQRQGEAVRLHRLIGWTGEHDPITKGDWLTESDPVWPASTVRGRAVAMVTGYEIASLETSAQHNRARLVARLSRPTGRLLHTIRRLRPLAPEILWRLARRGIFRLLGSGETEGR